MTPVKTSLNAPAPAGVLDAPVPAGMREKGSLWNRMLFWITIALDPEAVAWNWGGFTPALLSYSEALRATGRPIGAPDSAVAVSDAEKPAAQEASSDTFQRAA